MVSLSKSSKRTRPQVQSRFKMRMEKCKKARTANNSSKLGALSKVTLSIP
jgi:hypothetical protein